LKFEKDGSLAECASGAPKSIADKKVRKSAQGGAWKSEKRTPPCARGFSVGINIIFSVVAQSSTLSHLEEALLAVFSMMSLLILSNFGIL
jgi:hypothetical protein